MLSVVVLFDSVIVCGVDYSACCFVDVGVVDVVVGVAGGVVCNVAVDGVAGVVGCGVRVDEVTGDVGFGVDVC